MSSHLSFTNTFQSTLKLDASKVNSVIFIGCVHADRPAEGKSQKQQTEAVPDPTTWGVPLPHLLSGTQSDN